MPNKDKEAGQFIRKRKLECLVALCRALIHQQFIEEKLATPENREFKKKKFSFVFIKDIIVDKFWHFCSHL